MNELLLLVSIAWIIFIVPVILYLRRSIKKDNQEIDALNNLLCAPPDQIYQSIYEYNKELRRCVYCGKGKTDLPFRDDAFIHSKCLDEYNKETQT